MQALPVSSLPPLLALLKKAKVPETPIIASIYAALLEQAESADKAKKDADAKEKWDIWCGLYGQSRADWAPMPKENVEWGWWAAYPVDRETWWNVPPKE